MAITMDGIFVNGQKVTFHPENILSGDASAYTEEIGTAVEEWMEENVTGGEQVTDTTLTLPGVPADSKKTGDEIGALKEDLNSISENIGAFVSQTDLQDVVTINSPKNIFGVEFDLVANQSGSGDPSPTNVRTISAQTGATLKHSGDDTSNPDLIAIGTGTVYRAHVDTNEKSVTETATLIDLSSLSWSYQAAVSAFYVNMTALPSVSNKGSNASDFFGMCDTYKFVPYASLTQQTGYLIAVRSDPSVKRLYVKTESQDVTPTGYALLELATPSTSSISAVNIAPKDGVNKLWIDGIDISVIYAIAAKEYVDDKSASTNAEVSTLDAEISNISNIVNTYIDDSSMQTAFAGLECVRATYYTGYIHKYGTDETHLLNKETLKYPFKVRVRCKSGYDFGVEEMDKAYTVTGNIAMTSIRSSDGRVTDYVCNANANILIILRKINGTIADISEWSDALEISIYPGDFYDFAKNLTVPVYTTPSAFDAQTLYTETSASQRVAQGMCTDGTYLYCSYQTAASSSYPTDIIKIDIATGAEVARVQGMYGHANDICYDPANDYILVIFTTARSVMMRFNASDLSYVDTIDFTSIATGINADYNFIAITYMPDYGRYVFGVANVNTLVGFAYMLTDFTLEKFVKIMPMSHVQQNIDYISGMIVVSQYNPSNRIVFYNFDGQVISIASAPTGLELESVAITNGIYYMLYNLDAYSKLQIYACTPVDTVDTAMALVKSQYVP